MTTTNKSVIEMAREAGLIATEFGAVHGDVYHIERFAAIVREDEREKHDSIAKYALEAARRALKYLDAGRFTDASDYASDFWKAMEKLADWEAGVGTDEREKQQEPVAVMMKQPFSDTKIPIPPMIHWMNGFIPEVGTTLYTTPPTAALAARQMRDACMNLFYPHDPKGLAGTVTCISARKAIAALPVPEVQWRDLTDEEIEEAINSSEGDDLIKDIRAVIAKFKEKQL